MRSRASTPSRPASTCTATTGPFWPRTCSHLEITCGATRSALARTNTTRLPDSRAHASKFTQRHPKGSLASNTSMRTSAFSRVRLNVSLCDFSTSVARFARRSASLAFAASRASAACCCCVSLACFLASSFLSAISFSRFSFFRSNSCSISALKGHVLGIPGSLRCFFFTPNFFASFRIRRLCSRTLFWMLYFRLNFVRLLFLLPLSFMVLLHHEL
mmetsp:Transcript_25138/g.57068  ORF Transcript_25138/g.57068 Transcript_25138/m.57068 type:complete len:216 (+) Transcript_25138:113-760(+)